MKLIKEIGFLSAFVLPALLLAGYWLGGGWNFLTAGFVFLVIPLADYWIGSDKTRFTDSEKQQLASDFYYTFILYIWTYLQLGTVVFGCYAVTLGRISSPLEWVGFTLGTALITGGIGITVAHELGHKKSSLQQFYAQFILMCVSYMHFFIEHNKGHHVWVGTPADPATARRNEPFYSFWVRTIRGSYRHAWQLERQRLRRKQLPFWSHHNTMLQYHFYTLLFMGVLIFGFSLAAGSFAWEVPVFFVAQSILAFTLLEIVNYIEHYGLYRNEITPGRYEPVSAIHSWNANHLLTNFFLFQLQRHSDHHLQALKKYQELDNLEESPQLPAGYPTMLILALIPPVWFSIVNPILTKWEKITTESMPSG